jgi:hypothetical protein
MAKKKATTAKAPAAPRRRTTKKAAPAKANETTEAGIVVETIEVTAAVATALPFDVAAIGHTAGQVWQVLHAAGNVPLSAVKKQVAASPDLVTAALGWLAREGKLVIEPNGRATYVRLCE